MIYRKYLQLTSDSASLTSFFDPGSDGHLFDLHNRKRWDKTTKEWRGMDDVLVRRMENALFQLYDDFKKNARQFGAVNPINHEQTK